MDLILVVGIEFMTYISDGIWPTFAADVLGEEDVFGYGSEKAAIMVVGFSIDSKIESVMNRNISLQNTMYCTKEA